MPLNERDLHSIRHLRERIQVMEAAGYSREEVCASISVYESRFLSPPGRMTWLQQRQAAKQTGRIFALRNNPKSLDLNINFG